MLKFVPLILFLITANTLFGDAQVKQVCSDALTSFPYFSSVFRRLSIHSKLCKARSMRSSKITAFRW